MGNTISICLITRNEENNLERCFNSVKDIADEIIVVDTGSTDNTIEKAKTLGAKVYKHKWENSFSKARNYALDKCTKEWVFVIDADEALENGNGKQLKKLLSNTDKEAFYMRLNNIIGTEIINENPTIRIFRNRKEYRYENRLHEQVVESIMKKGIEVFGTTNLVLNHYGYDHNVVDMNKKVLRNIEVLKGYGEEERDAIYYFGLGNEYMKIGNFKDAKEMLINALDYKEKDQGTETYAAACIVQTCYQLEEFDIALKYADKYIEKYPDFRDLYFLRAVCNNAVMNYSQSYIDLTIFDALPVKVEKYPSFNFEGTNDIKGLIAALDKQRNNIK